MAEMPALMKMHVEAQLCAVTVRPGDTLVVAYPDRVHKQALDDLHKRIGEKLPGVNCVIVDGVQQLLVYRPDEELPPVDGQE